MRKRIVLMFVLSFGLFLQGQTASKPGDSASQSELTEFKAFIEQHPHALAALRNNPSQLGTPQFAQNFRAVGQYVAAHPKLIEAFKANPKFVEGLNAKRAGGSGGGTGGGDRKR
jgi:hypothetical protein